MDITALLSWRHSSCKSLPRSLSAKSNHCCQRNDLCLCGASTCWCLFLTHPTKRPKAGMVLQCTNIHLRWIGWNQCLRRGQRQCKELISGLQLNLLFDQTIYEFVSATSNKLTCTDVCRLHGSNKSPYVSSHKCPSLGQVWLILPTTTVSLTLLMLTLLADLWIPSPFQPSYHRQHKVNWLL